MKKNSNLVQTIVLVVFGLGIILGVLFFSGKITLPWDKEAKNTITGPVTIWGILPYQQAKALFDGMQQSNEGLRITYEQKEPEKMQTELVNALASGKGPDLFMMSPGEVAENIDRLYIVPYETYPDTVFKNNFIDAADIFMTTQGILAFPLFIDPMVMYYNRDLLTSNYITKPPTTWTELEESISTLTQKDDASKIKQATVPLGTTNNTSNPLDILVLKILQAGNPITTQQFDNWVSLPNENNELTDAITWFISFSSTIDKNYSWNQSLPKDKDFFTAGNLVYYFGYPTEYDKIRQKNPNLNFAMAMTPQLSATSKKVNYGKLYTVGISKLSKNLPGAIGVMGLLTSKDTMSALVTGTNYAPARRDLLSEKPKDDANRALVFNSSIISKAFLDPDASQTNRLILNTVDQINAGTRNIQSGVEAISSGLQNLVSKMKLPEKPLP